MEEAVLKFLETGPKRSWELISEFGASPDLAKTLGNLVHQNKIIPDQLPKIKDNSRWSKIE